MRTLVIDDIRTFKGGELDESMVVYARTPEEGVRLLSQGEWEQVVLDHDLGMNLETFESIDIWPCVEYIENNRNRFRDTQFVVVSSNPYGAASIEAALQSIGLKAFRLTESQKAKYFQS